MPEAAAFDRNESAHVRCSFHRHQQPPPDRKPARPLDYQILQRTLRPKDGQAAAEATTSPTAHTTIPLEVATDTSTRGLGDAVRFDLYGDVRIDAHNIVFGRLLLLRFDKRG